MRDQSSAVATTDELDTRSRYVAWYQKELAEVPESARELLEQYSKIPPEKVKDHVLAIRDKAWEIFPYPCIGGFRFIDLNLPTTAQYADIISRLQSGQKLLDLGCCFGQEMRKLIHDGAPPEALYGLDLRQEFFDLGYELFVDRGRCTSKFFAANIFDPPTAEVEALNGEMDVVYAGAFFHLFDRPEQLILAKRVAGLLSDKPGSMVLGRQVGNVNPGRYEHATNKDGWMYRHDAGSWRELWEEAGRETGTRWDVWAELKSSPRFAKMGHDSGSMQMYFVVTRK